MSNTSRIKPRSTRNQSASTVRVYDFFSGCGGTSVGFRQAGIAPALAIDSCSDAIATYKKNFPSVPTYCNLIQEITPTTIKSHFLPENEVRLFCGCAPCQPFTKQKTNSKVVPSSDERRSLLTYFSAFVESCLPELVFVENVPGLQSIDANQDGPFPTFLQVLKDLEYHTAVEIVAAQDFGTAQVRRRLVLMASRYGPIDLPTPTHGQNRKYRHLTVRDAIFTLPAIEHGTKHTNESRYPNHRAAKLSPLNLERIQNTNGKGRKDWPEHLLPRCYAPKPNGERYQGHSDCYTRLSWDEPAPGLTTRCISYSNGRFGHPDQDRALSIREAARLQGFPNSFVFTGCLNSMARQIGNAVPVPLAKAIGLQFLRHLKELDKKNGKI